MKFSAFLILALFAHSSFGQSFSKIYGRDKFWGNSPITYQKNQSTYLTFRGAIDLDSGSFFMVKTNALGEPILNKRFYTPSRFAYFPFSEIEFISKNSFIFNFLNFVFPDSGSLISKVDTNFNILKSITILGSLSNAKLRNNHLFFNFGLWRGSTIPPFPTIIKMNENLDVVQHKICYDTLGIGIWSLLSYDINKKLILGTFSKTINQIIKNQYILKIDTSLDIGSFYRLPYPQPESSSSIYNINFVNDSICIFTCNYITSTGDTADIGRYNFLSDSIELFKYRQKFNPEIDPPPALFTRHLNLNFYGKSSDSTFKFFSEFRGSEFLKISQFLVDLNTRTLKSRIYRINQNQRTFLDYPVLTLQIPNPKPDLFTYTGIKPFVVKNFFGQALVRDQDLSSPGNCYATRDTCWIERLEKFKLVKTGELFFRDTSVAINPITVLSNDIPLCEMDFCNPLSYSGLGPDISTCADSVILNGAIVYPGQKLEWSSGDTTLRVKIPVTAQPKSISIKISGICGTFDDTLVLRQSGAQAVSFNQPDSLLRCQPILLAPTTQSWQNPAWRTPRGLVSGDTSLLADTSGRYIIQNGADNCARRDTVFVEIRPTVQPKLNLPDTVKSCLPVPIQATGSPLVNLRWATPQGQISGVSQVVANLSGKYRVENEQLGCAKADSVFILIRNRQTVQISPPQDSLLTCKSQNLSTQLTRAINFSWFSPQGQILNQPQILAKSTGWYIAQNDTGNCLNRDSIYIRFRDTANADFILQTGGRRILKFDTLLQENQLPLSLTAITQTQAALFRWYLNGTLQAGNDFTQNFILPDEGSYQIQLLATGQDSCLAKAEKDFRIRKLILPALELPNLVTSNGDGKNDLLEIEVLSFYPENELVIFNRWGQEVFKASPYQNNWPSADTQPGTYFYILQAGGRSYKGWVMVGR